MTIRELYDIIGGTYDQAVRLVWDYCVEPSGQNWTIEYNSGNGWFVLDDKMQVDPGRSRASFDADGTGHTWDVDDDITEDEATPFSWEAYDKAIMMTHKLRIRGIVPRYYELDRLNAFDLRFHDTYSDYALERVDEQMAMEDDILEDWTEKWIYK